MQQLQDDHANYVLVTDTDNLVHKLCHWPSHCKLRIWSTQKRRNKRTKDLFYNNFTLILLVGLHYPRRVNATPVALLPSVSYATFLQLKIPVFLMSFFTTSFHQALVFLSSSIPTDKCSNFIFNITLQGPLSCFNVLQLMHLRFCSSVPFAKL
jgi:hypothetical protein